MVKLTTKTKTNKTTAKKSMGRDEQTNTNKKQNKQAITTKNSSFRNNRISDLV
jgi:hypothetical protein